MSDPIRRTFFMGQCGRFAVGIHQVNPRGEVFLAIWRRSSPPGCNPSNRWVQAWEVLRYGSPYAERVILEPEQAIELGRALIRIGERGVK